MVFGSKFGFWAIFALVQFVRSDTVFSSQFLGNYLTDQEYESSKKCDTKVCLLDADRLIYAATRNGSIKPCDDFKTFSMGEFYLHRKKNDRYPAIGFQLEVEHLLQERYRNALKSPIHEDDLRVHKFLKSHFKKCTDTDHIIKHSGDEILAYLNSIGGSPLIADGTWDDSKFDVGKLLELEALALIFLTDQGILRCKAPSKDPEQDRADSICLIKAYAMRNDKDDLLKIVKRFAFEKGKQQKVVQDYEKFIKIMSANFDSDFNQTSNTKLMRVKNLSAAFPHFKINWLKLFNNRLFSTSQVTEDEEIFFKYPESFNQTLMLLSTMDKGLIANVFTAKYLLKRVDLFFTHFLTSDSAKYHGSKQGLQRFENCIQFPRYLKFKLALDSLLAKRKFNKEIQNAAKEFVMEVVADFASEVEENRTTNNEQELIKQEVIGKLKNVQLQVMFLDEALNDSIINKLYEELDFDEKMPFLEMQFAMESYFLKVNYERQSSWIATLNRDLDEDIQYSVDKNVLVVPAKYTLPPLFVVNRPRFFNVATLYTFVHAELSKGFHKYLTKKKKFNVFPLDLDKVSLADKYYVKWEENGGKELKLSSFKLTNRQMLWLCMANVYAIQYQRKKNATFNPIPTLQSDYFHLNFKKQERFREAFQCDELTQQEEKMLSEYNKIRKSIDE